MHQMVIINIRSAFKTISPLFVVYNKIRETQEIAWCCGRLLAFSNYI